MKKFDSQKSQKFMEGFVKVGKIVLKAALAIGSVAILSKINDELGQLGIKVDLNGGDISVETKKKDEKKASSATKAKTIDELTWPKTPQVLAIISLSESANQSYSNSVKTDAASKIFDIASNGDLTAVECGISRLRSIANQSYSNAVKQHCTDLICKLGIIASELDRKADKIDDTEEKDKPESAENFVREKEENHE